MIPTKRWPKWIQSAVDCQQVAGFQIRGFGFVNNFVNRFSYWVVSLNCLKPYSGLIGLRFEFNSDLKTAFNRNGIIALKCARVVVRSEQSVYHILIVFRFMEMKNVNKAQKRHMTPAAITLFLFAFFSMAHFLFRKHQLHYFVLFMACISYFSEFFCKVFISQFSMALTAPPVKSSLIFQAPKRTCSTLATAKS